MMHHRELLRAHIGALYTKDAADRLVRINESGGKKAPRFFLGRTAEGGEWWFRHDLTDDIVHSLQAACAAAPDGMLSDALPDAASPFQTVLERAAPIEAIWSGPAFCFPNQMDRSPFSVVVTQANADLLEPHLSSWCDDVARGKTMYAVVVGGQMVSVCASVRVSEVAHEAGVETATAFRGNGYAGHAISAWAAAVRSENRVPIYSTSWTNTASRVVAQKLGLIQFSSDLHIT